MAAIEGRGEEKKTSSRTLARLAQQLDEDLWVFWATRLVLSCKYETKTNTTSTQNAFYKSVISAIFNKLLCRILLPFSLHSSVVITVHMVTKAAQLELFGFDFFFFFCF